MIQDDLRPALRLGGVPEHFNAPWHHAVEAGDFDERPYRLSWQDFPGGTGAMAEALATHKLDAALMLTEGLVAAILRGLPLRILGSYVSSPLRWGIHVHARSPLRKPEDLAGRPFAISRFGSGSHLMAFVEAEARGWLGQAPLRFVEVGGLEGARLALERGEADGFLWEQTMTQPLVASGEWRCLGTRLTPWPAFLIAARVDALEPLGAHMLDALAITKRRCDTLRVGARSSVEEIAARFGLARDEVARWLNLTRWQCTPEVDPHALRVTLDTLRRLGLSEHDAAPESLIARGLCALRAPEHAA